MTDENIYLGSPGALQQIYWPFGGIDGTRPRDSSLFRTGSGGARMSRLLDGVRTYTLDYGGLGRENFAILEAYDQGHMGPGPFVFLDPGRRNLLTVNQSASTSQTNDTTGFTLTTDGTHSITSDATTPTRVPRTLKWTFTASTPSSSLLRLNSPTSLWPGIPIIRRDYTFSFVAKTFGGSFIFLANIDWLDITGALISTATSGNLFSQFSWLPFWVTATPPSNAVWARPYIDPSDGSIIAGDGINISDLQFNEGPREAWSPGTGILPVQVVSHRDLQPDGVPSFRKGNTLVLQEVK